MTGGPMSTPTNTDPPSGRTYEVDPEQGDSPGCDHLDELLAVGSRPAEGCEECLRDGTRWVHLRQCLNCGHVGCCDSSPQRHATKHFEATGHPVMASAQPGEDWAWCFVDQLALVPVAG